MPVTPVEPDAVELSGAVKYVASAMVGFGALVLLLVAGMTLTGTVPSGPPRFMAYGAAAVLGIWPIVLGLWGHGDRMYVDSNGLSRYRYRKLKQRVEWSDLVEVRPDMDKIGGAGSPGSGHWRVNGYVLVARSHLGEVTRLSFNPMAWGRRDAFYGSFAPVVRSRPDLIVDDGLRDFFEKHVRRFAP